MLKERPKCFGEIIPKNRSQNACPNARWLGKRYSPFRRRLISTSQRPWFCGFEVVEDIAALLSLVIFVVHVIQHVIMCCTPVPPLQNSNLLKLVNNYRKSEPV